MSRGRAEGGSFGRTVGTCQFPPGTCAWCWGQLQTVEIAEGWLLVLGQVGRGGEWTWKLLCMWCCYVEGLHGKTGKMVSKNVVCPWDVGNTDVIVALGS